MTVHFRAQITVCFNELLLNFNAHILLTRGKTGTSRFWVQNTGDEFYLVLLLIQMYFKLLIGRKFIYPQNFKILKINI